MRALPPNTGGPFPVNLFGLEHTFFAARKHPRSRGNIVLSDGLGGRHSYSSAPRAPVRAHAGGIDGEPGVGRGRVVWLIWFIWVICLVRKRAWRGQFFWFVGVCCFFHCSNQSNKINQTN